MWKLAVGRPWPQVGPMRSPFAAIRSWLSQVLGCLVSIVEALRGIVGTMRAMESTLAAFEARESPQPGPEEHNRMNVLEAGLADLTLAVAEGVNNVQRSERRVRAVVTGARRQLAEAGYEHAGLEAEHGELRSLDADSGNGEPVPAVPEAVDGLDPHRASVIPGMTVRQMQVAHARRR